MMNPESNGADHYFCTEQDELISLLTEENEQ